eukprot:CAMPEP_0171996916 /NCGR_PEP_ID=MMETSP1041-20130122/405_1 /TAXON_ID=464988 /ORGANISM="Hemiselmis andersenii, Strain CCMP439" /LENGTH=108 /DNA_ID=CAMNT_0012650149 /DNA_START=448 /DNA_END=775 /DNA_ORIENTATION=+
MKEPHQRADPDVGTHAKPIAVRQPVAAGRLEARLRLVVVEDGPGVRALLLVLVPLEAALSEEVLDLVAALVLPVQFALTDRRAVTDVVPDVLRHANTRVRRPLIKGLH